MSPADEAKLNTSELNLLCELAIQKMNESDFEGALNLAYKVKALGQNYIVSYITSGLLIDIGSALGNEKIIKEGGELLQRNLEAIISHKKYSPTAYYNLANAYSVLSSLKRIRDPYYACFKETDMDRAKVYYRKALEFDIEDPMLKAQILVNLGNCFDSLGRVIDALECYDKSLELKPDHGMALGNKGQALLYYAALSGEHQGTFIMEAYSLLNHALELGVPPEAVRSFEEPLKLIKEKYMSQRALETQPNFPGYTIKAKSKLERFLVEFCLRNRLYLNICNFCQKGDAAIGDTAVIKKMIVPISKNSYLASSAYLNQIKQDYVTARFLLILSRYDGLNLSFADKRVTIIDTLDYSVHNVNIQLVKTSFRVFYDILDKIAFFINDYLELGVPERRIDFRQLWHIKDGTIREKIQNTKNPGLNALYDVYKDFEIGPYKELKNTRHALTHRFVNIRTVQEIENEENMTEETLVERTLELAKIVRSSIMYLLHFVYVEESKRELKVKGRLGTKLAFALPDYLKTSRRNV